MQSENFIPQNSSEFINGHMCAASFPKTFSRVAKRCIIPPLCKPDSNSKLARKLANSQPIESPPRIRGQKEEEEDSQHAIHGRTSLDFIQFIRSRAASVFWHFKGNTSDSISFVPAYESNCIGCRAVCLFIKTSLGSVFTRRVHFADA